MSNLLDMAKRDEPSGEGEPQYKPSIEPPPLTDWVPYRGVRLNSRWQGPMKVKPWDRKVTIVIPTLDVPELLDVAIAAWKAQTVDANILLIDTGSSDRYSGVLDEYERTQQWDIEVHRLRFRAVKHPSDPVAIAMDLAFSLCTTPYLFATHADCFPARSDLIEWMIGRSCANYPVVGYQITDREGIDTSGWVGHTATLFDMKAADDMNLAWSQRRLCNLTGMDHFGNNRCNGYPDTEFLVNEQMDRAGVKRLLIGKEVNYVTTDDANILHVRSYVSSKLYSPEHHAKATIDMEQALTITRERTQQWNNLL